MGSAVISDKTCTLVDALRAEGVRFTLVTGARTSTLLKRWPLLPACDARACESGGRIYLNDGVDCAFAATFEAITGPVEREDVGAENRPEPLWQWFRSVASAVPGAQLDARSYYSMFRVDSRDDPTVAAALRAHVAKALPDGLAHATNLGKTDFFPSASGKGNAVQYLQGLLGVRPEESAALFDDDNDLPMAEQCAVRLLPSLTSESVARAAREQPGWHVASTAGQGVFATEELLEGLLVRVRREKAEDADEALLEQMESVLPLAVPSSSEQAAAGKQESKEVEIKEKEVGAGEQTANGDEAQP